VLFCAAAWLALASAPPPAAGQACRVSMAGLNRARRVMGPVHTECPGSIHTPPFGNWGVTSNFGHKLDGHQFDGWCRDRYICDNQGYCRRDCRDGWYEWNSCTDDQRFAGPNCTLYNSDSCTQQVSATDVNVLGTLYFDIPTDCPFDTNNDGACDSGGCRDVSNITYDTPFMSLYELDRWGTDEIVQTLYYGTLAIFPWCEPWRCSAAGSSWETPTFYDNPSWPPKVDAHLAMVLNWGSFVDRSGICAAYARSDPKYNCW
jgi:hypothetical protein